MSAVSHSDRVREHARRHYIEPARSRGDSTVSIIAGEVERSVHLKNRIPLVCQALTSRKFLDENGLILEKAEGPPSGISTTVKFVYRFSIPGKASSDAVDHAAFLRLRGKGKEVFGSLGGGEAFIRAERAAWAPEDKT